MKEQIQLKDKSFKLYLSEQKIQNAVNAIAQKINTDYAGKKPLFLAILNGSFMFAGDFMKRIEMECSISFVKVASYSGTQSTGQVKQLLGLDEDLSDRHVVILEDIVDTGTTIYNLLPYFNSKKPASVEVATLLLKPDSVRRDLHVKYSAISIPNDFIVGYGLDYDGLGRNLPAIYKIQEV